VPSSNIYQTEIEEKIKECLEDKGVQPILFLGSGLSRRYFNAPDWRGLLKETIKQLPKPRKNLEYYEQSQFTLPEIGQEIAELYKEWAWNEGQEEFPKNYFDSQFPKEIFLKHFVSEYLKGITPKAEGKCIKEYSLEIDLLKKIRPHAIITTNYDEFLERIFPDYQSIIGQKILSSESAFFGEIFKIHGCVTSPDSLVLTKKDYDDFLCTKKYLSAKLLTFFLEHPLLIVGYSAADENIKTILSDIDIILSANGRLIPNIFLLRRPKEGESIKNLPKEDIITVDQGRHIRVNSIISNDFAWVYKSFVNNGAIERIRPKLLRSLLARTYELVRHDIPKRALEVDYSVLEGAVSGNDELAKLYGITITGEASHVNINYPHTITDIGKKLGYKSWHQAKKLLNYIKDETGVDIMLSDNKYHVAVKIGTTIFHKYSSETLNLLKKLNEDIDYNFSLDGFDGND
jgi:hypothetical protein